MTPEQTAASETHRQFAVGDFVRKKSGAEWSGKIVGFYRTDLTETGYAIESEFHRNSVQIYPASAIERSVPEPRSVAKAGAQVDEGMATLMALDAETMARECDRVGLPEMAAWWRSRPEARRSAIA